MYLVSTFCSAYSSASARKSVDTSTGAGTEHTVPVPKTVLRDLREVMTEREKYVQSVKAASDRRAKSLMSSQNQIEHLKSELEGAVAERLRVQAQLEAVQQQLDGLRSQTLKMVNLNGEGSPTSTAEYVNGDASVEVTAEVRNFACAGAQVQREESHLIASFLGAKSRRTTGQICSRLRPHR